MRELNLIGLDDSDLAERVRSFVYKRQYSLPVCIVGGNQTLVIMVLENGDFRFIVDGGSIIVTG